MSTWDARRLFDLVRKVTHTYYRRKYGVLAKRMGRDGVDADGQRGFIIIQIDGLSYSHLQAALDGGAMPQVSKIVAEGRLTLSPWYCGLPSTTPAVQAGIMFGQRDDIPGFRWYEKDSQLSIVAKRPDHMRAVQTRVRGKVPGLLAGGSSYVNMFDGDADLVLFTLSAIHPQRFFESVRGMGLLLLFLLSPFRILRVFGRTLVDYLESLLWRLVAIFRPMVLRPYDVVAPFLGSAVNVLFTEVQTFGVALDIYRQVPAIYTNYNHYDEIAHRLGAEHRSALRVLRDIDRRIAQIDRMRRRYRGREYDLFILSDHGNTPSIPFSWETGSTLGQFVKEELGDQLSLGETFDGEGVSLVKTRYLLAEIETVTENMPVALRRIAKPLVRYVHQRVPTDPELEAYDLGRREDVVVRVSGPLAHLYFNVTARPLDLIEVMLLYPRLMDRLLATDSIGLVAGRAHDRVVALGPTGRMVVITDGAVGGKDGNWLRSFGDPERVARELFRVGRFPHTGDLILLGRVQPDGRVVTFEKQVATHGGLGGVQEIPFIAYPPSCDILSPEAPEELYRFFRKRYQGIDGNCDQS